MKIFIMASLSLSANNKPALLRSKPAYTKKTTSMNVTLQRSQRCGSFSPLFIQFKYSIELFSGSVFRISRENVILKLKFVKPFHMVRSSEKKNEYLLFASRFLSLFICVYSKWSIAQSNFTRLFWKWPFFFFRLYSVVS